LAGREFFPNLISGPFHHGLVTVFSAATAMAWIAALASALCGKRCLHAEPAAAEVARVEIEEPAAR
jgi:hypothetical protein